MLAHDLDAWLADIAAQHKPATARFYRNRSVWIRKALGDREWISLTSQQVLLGLDQANRWPDQNPKAPDTIRANIIAWEQFQKWAVGTGRCEKSIVQQEIKKPSGRLRERLPNIDEIGRILAEASPQFVAIYSTLLLTGARPGELCAAQVTNYDQSAGVIRLQDHKTAKKTGRPRHIPIGDAARPLVVAAIAGRTEGPIFRTPAGKAWTTDTLSQTFRRRRERLQLGDDLVLYSTRHKFATELCHAQGIEAAATVLGHSGLQITRRYVHHDTGQIVKYANAVDPRALLGTPPAPTTPENPQPE